MAFGESNNGIEMFDVVGFAVAMSAAQPALIKRADMVTEAIEESGIGRCCEKRLWISKVSPDAFINFGKVNILGKRYVNGI